MSTPGSDFATGMGAFNQIWQTAEDSKYRKRQAEWEDYVRGRQKADDAALDEGRADAIRRYSGDDGGFDVNGTLGLKPQGRMNFGPAPTGPAAGNNPFAFGMAPQPQQEAPAAPQKIGLGQSYDNNRAAALSAMRTANPQQLYEIQKSLAEQRSRAEASLISSHVLNASPDQLEQIAKQVTADKRNTWGIKADPNNPNLYIVSEGNTQVPMSRVQLAQWFGANHRLKNGDQSALTDIASIDDKLAAKAAESYSRAKDTATEKRQNFDSTSQDDYRQGELANARARLGLERERFNMVKDRRLSPETAAELNEIAAKANDESLTPAQRQGYAEEFNRKLALAGASEMGKLVLPKSGSGKPPVDIKWNFDAGVGTDAAGRIIARFDEEGGARPDGPDLRKDKKMVEALARDGLSVGPVETASGYAWGYKDLKSGRTFSTREEALDAQKNADKQPYNPEMDVTLRRAGVTNTTPPKAAAASQSAGLRPRQYIKNERGLIAPNPEYATWLANGGKAIVDRETAESDAADAAAVAAAKARQRY